jgi:hypothetical protein
MQRFDVSEIKATRTDEGFILDTPAITRCGVFPYRNADGTMRYELRHPDDVFKQDSLDSIKGKPVTAMHHGMINNGNSVGVTVGAVMSAGRQDGDNVTAEIVIHDTSMVDGGNKDLSCGYTLNLDEESGVYNGQPYTHRQRDIKYNHLAIVKAGRAGNARLNLDSMDFQEDKETMVKYRLDNGVEYDVTPEIDAELKKLNQDVADANAAKEAEKARADAAEDAKAKAEASIAKAREDAANEVKARLKLEADAKALNVEFKEDATDSEIKIAVIKSVRTNFDATDKAEAYIDAAYDLARMDAQEAGNSVGAQRKQLNQDSKPVLTSEQVRLKQIQEGKL